MTDSASIPQSASAEELSRLLAEEVRQRTELREELISAYRKQESQLSRIIVLEDLLRHRSVASFAAVKVLSILPSGQSGSQRAPQSAKNLAKHKAKAAYTKSRSLAGSTARKLGLRK